MKGFSFPDLKRLCRNAANRRLEQFRITGRPDSVVTEALKRFASDPITTEDFAEAREVTFPTNNEYMFDQIKTFEASMLRDFSP